jgi:hypothetical protein
MQRLVFFAALVVGSAACPPLVGFAVYSPSQALPLDQPLATTTHIIYAPGGHLAAPSDPGELGLLSRIARVAGVPFGFEADDADPRPATGVAVEPHEVPGGTLRAALDAFVALDPRYEWRDMNGVLVMRTRGAWTNRRDVLNQPVRDVDWRDVDVIAAFNRVARLLYPASPHDAFEGMTRAHDRPFSVHVSEGTLLDVLDAAVRADGELGWAVCYGSAPGPMRFTLTLGHYGNGPTLGWPERPQAGSRPR